MMPVLVHPMALIGLVSLPVLLTWYLLRTRFQPRQVSSLMLWQRLQEPSQGGARIERLRLPLLFLLECIAAAMLVCAAALPAVQMARAHRLLVVVLDDSASMSALVSSETVRTRAERVLMGELAAGNYYSVKLLLATAPPRLLGDTAVSPREVPKALQQWTCRAPGDALDAAVASAIEQAGAHGRVLVLTDRAPRDKSVPPRVRWQACGIAADNIAFINAARSTSTTDERWLFEIANCARAPGATQFTVRDANGHTLTSERLSIPSTGVVRRTLSVPLTAGMVTATLGDDALAIDNRVILPPARQHRVRTAIHIADAALNRAVSRAVKATGNDAPPGAVPELVVTDSRNDTGAGPGTWIVRFIASTEGEAFMGPFMTDARHPLMDGLTFDGVVWGGAANVALTGTPVVMAGNVVLAADAAALDGTHVVTMQYAPARSTMDEMPQWPALFWNLLAWRAANAPGPCSDVIRVGMNAAIIADNSASITIEFPDGSSRPMPSAQRHIIFPADEPGMYIVKDATRAYRLAANFLAREESDLSSATAGRWDGWTDATVVKREYAHMGWVCALIALAALALHQRMVAKA